MNKYYQDAIAQIQQSIRFNSELAPEKEGAPFGKTTADCLEHFLSLASSLGFQTKNYDNYIGEVLYGEGAESFAVLGHLDVVPAGKGWQKDPFGGEIAEGKIWGRGATDDKGPIICALYALKSLKDKGFRPSKQIKLIVGCNEESGWKCIEHYNEVATMPDEGFSPDADFPVIYAEKGILQLCFHFPVQNAPFSRLEGGEKGNMVCDDCQAIPLTVDLKKAEKLNLIVEDGKLISKGKSAHGSTPHFGKNAILPLLQYFSDNDGVNSLIKLLFDDIYGLKSLRDETGNLTMSPNIIKWENNRLSVVVDIRYPASMPQKEILAKLDKFGVDYEILHAQNALYHDKNSPLVQTLLQIYTECTGQTAEPIAIGGGTYARALKNGVGFGPEIPGECANIHQPNEFISLSTVELLLNAYEKAIERLTK